jgi:hypothetical protein
MFEAISLRVSNTYSLSIEHRRRFPRKSMSPYAAQDTESRASIEAIVFRSVCLRNDKQDLDCFVRYVVGNRRHHVRHISLPCVAWDQKSGMDAVFTDTISRLFAHIAQWHDVATGCRDVYLGLLHMAPGSGNPERTQPNFLELADLPMPTVITSFSCSFQLPVGQLVTLLRRMPQLREISIQRSNINFAQYHPRSTDTERIKRKFLHTCIDCKN